MPDAAHSGRREVARRDGKRPTPLGPDLNGCITLARRDGHNLNAPRYDGNDIDRNGRETCRQQQRNRSNGDRGVRASHRTAGTYAACSGLFRRLDGSHSDNVVRIAPAGCEDSAARHGPPPATHQTRRSR